MPRRELTIADRTFTIYDDGDPEGPVILQHHGTPGAGGPLQMWIDEASRRGWRFLTYDRPGYSGSTPSPGRTVADAAADSAAILDELGIERCVAWGISGGGPHALACAALLPERVAAVASLGGVAPFDAPGLNYFRGMGADNLIEFGLTMAGRAHVERFARQVADEMLNASREDFMATMATLVSAPDQAALEGAVGDHMYSLLGTNFAQGVSGWVDDDLAFVMAFGFEPADIQVPTLIVHGTQDRFVPVEHGRWLASAVPGAEAWISEDEGHLSLLARRVDDVHEWLLAHL